MGDPGEETDEPADAGDTPSRVGRYRLEEVVGAGAFTTVHRAYDPQLAGTVAVRVLNPGPSGDPEARERFMAEGRALRQVTSAHVVRVHDTGETAARQPYLVLEYAAGGTLAGRVTELSGPTAAPDGPDADGRWLATRADVLLVARSLAAATDALHRADLVHRDLSPGNLLIRSTTGTATGLSTVTDGAGGPSATLLGPDEELVLADLGLTGDLASGSGTSADGGPADLRSPEQRATPGWVDSRADLWALSALIVWLITGRPPGDDPATVAPALATKGFTRPLADALARSLAFEPSARHRDVAAWVDEVETALTTVSTTVAVDGEVGGDAEGTSPSTSRAAVPAEIGPRPTPPWRSRLPLPASWGGTDRTWRPPPPAGPSARRAGGRGRRVVRGVLILAIGAALGSGAFAFATRDDGGGRGEITRAQRGEVEVVDAADGARLVLRGPEEVAPGEAVKLTVDGEGLTDWVWLLPDGTVLASDSEVTVTLGGTGPTAVTVVGMTGTGERLEVGYDLEVVG